MEEDTKIPNAATVTINKEDHTLAGMLRSCVFRLLATRYALLTHTSLAIHRQLLQLPNVLFAGYKVPHPLEPRFIIKIQTTSESTPIQAVQEACKALIITLSKMRDAFQKEFDTAKTMGASMGLENTAGAGQQEGYGGAAGNAAQGAMDEGLGGEAYEEGFQPGGFSEFI